MLHFFMMLLLMGAAPGKPLTSKLIESKSVYNHVFNIHLYHVTESTANENRKVDVYLMVLHLTFPSCTRHMML